VPDGAGKETCGEQCGGKLVSLGGLIAVGRFGVDSRLEIFDIRLQRKSVHVTRGGVKISVLWKLNLKPFSKTKSL
jgi:hypothetical protein